MTTEQLDRQIAGAHAELLRLQPLAKQYEAMKEAAKQIKDVSARLADLRDKRDKEEARVLADSMTFISSMDISEAENSPPGNRLHNPVTVTITWRNGQHARKPLHTLEDVERRVLFAQYWKMVPPWIRALGSTPEDAHRQYVGAKLRGYLRG